ncbi:MAG TPA: M28 family peptidase [Candidatus Alistipes intestinipullorum]|nr:M28 family peptidase [Candidatus Alistipes intestinipullorum]
MLLRLWLNSCRRLAVPGVLAVLWMVAPTGCSRSARPSMACDPKAMYATIETLCSDSLAGRRAGSGNDLRAARFLASELNTVGCVPLWRKALVPFSIDGAVVRRGMERVLAGEWRDSSYNVVMTIRSRYPDAEKVLLGAHYDHLGRFKADKGGRYSAGDQLLGANDNASGTAAVVEIARRLQPYADDFRRDLVVALFGAEEMGLAGSRHLERMLRDSSVTIGHMVNLEMFGRMRGDTLCLQGEILSPVSRVVECVGNPDSLRIELSARGSAGSSDHVAFASQMIPVSFFITTDISTLHTVDDTPESLDMEGMERAVNYIMRYVYTLLTSDQLPKLQENS